MPRYDKTYEAFATRAVKAAVADMETFIELGRNNGLSIDTLENQLLRDLSNDGPIFGRFFRSLGSAAENSVYDAYRQGQQGGELEASRNLRRLLRISETEGSLLKAALDTADPEALADVEGALGPVVEYMSVAELVNTCHICLPLHGKVLTLDEWKAKGLLPAMRHEGWASRCHCHLVPQEKAGEIESKRKAALAPLKRNKIESATGLKGLRKTERAVTQLDVDRAMKARDDALQTEQGRRTLRLLGQMGTE